MTPQTWIGFDSLGNTLYWNGDPWRPRRKIYGLAVTTSQGKGPRYIKDSALTTKKGIKTKKRNTLEGGNHYHDVEIVELSPMGELLKSPTPFRSWCLDMNGQLFNCKPTPEENPDTVRDWMTFKLDEALSELEPAERLEARWLLDALAVVSQEFAERGLCQQDCARTKKKISPVINKLLDIDGGAIVPLYIAELPRILATQRLNNILEQELNGN